MENLFPFNLPDDLTNLYFLKVEGSPSFLNQFTTRKIETADRNHSGNYTDSSSNTATFPNTFPNAILDNKAQVLFLFVTCLIKINKGSGKNDCQLLVGCDPQLKNYLEDRQFLEDVKFKAIEKSDIQKNEVFKELTEFLTQPLPDLIKQGYYFLIPTVYQQLINHSILEHDLELFVSNDKGCFPGQEVTTRFQRKNNAYFKTISVLTPSINTVETISYNLTNREIEEVTLKDATNDHVVGTAWYHWSPPSSVGDNATNTSTASTHSRVPSFFLGRFLSNYLNREVLSLKVGQSIITGKLQPISSITINSEHSTDIGNEDKGRDKDKKKSKQLSIALDHYHSDQLDEARLTLQHILETDPDYTDALEALAVIEEKLGNIDTAVELNQRFQTSDPQAVMAHTNLSRLYMLQGKVTAAEEEKKLATIQMFRNTAKNSYPTPQKKDRDIQNSTDASSGSTTPTFQPSLKSEEARKMTIFKQVLEMDGDDITANFGIGKIYYDTDHYQEAVNHLEKVIANDPGYSMAYLYLTKSLLELSRSRSRLGSSNNQSNYRNKIRDTLEKGLQTAEEKGELMPLQAMKEIAEKIKNEE